VWFCEFARPALSIEKEDPDTFESSEWYKNCVCGTDPADGVSLRVNSGHVRCIKNSGNATAPGTAAFGEAVDLSQVVASDPTTWVAVMPDNTFEALMSAPGWWQDKSAFDTTVASKQQDGQKHWSKLWFRTCPNGGRLACPGATNETTTCARGFEGVLCAACARGLVAVMTHDALQDRYVPTCVVCSEVDFGPLLALVGIAVALLLIAGAVVFYVHRRVSQKHQKARTKVRADVAVGVRSWAHDANVKTPEKKVEEEDLHNLAVTYDRNLGVKMKIAIGFFQVQSAFNRFLPVAWSKENDELHGAAGVANFDVSSSPAVRCMMHKYFSQLLFVTLLPVLLGIVLPAAGYFACRGSVQRKALKSDAANPAEATRDLKAKCLTAAVAVIIAFFPGTSKKIFGLFACDSNFMAGDSGWMKEDYTVHCDSSEYHAWQWYAVSMTILFPIGVPLGFFLIIFWLGRRKQLYRRYPADHADPSKRGTIVYFESVPIPQHEAGSIYGSLFLGCK
jgi:hypothetical protein